jgi:tripartite-type tricarboxylate transporter receptor subunit TctC
LHALLAEACQTDEVQRAMALGGTTPFVMAPDATRRFQADELTKWGAIIRAAGMQPE